MHRRAPVLICIALLAAPAVMAAETAKPAKGKAAGNLAPPPAPKSAIAAGLRGPAEAAAPPKLILARPMAPPITPLRMTPLAQLSGATPFAGDRAAECRRTCAATRYVCLADPDRDDCGSVWGQCVAACARPSGERFSF
jgi:hypothetical protein